MSMAPGGEKSPRQWLRTKSVEESIIDTDDPEQGLPRSLSARDLTVLGVGVIIGTGIFVLTGQVARTTSGPAVAISFAAAGVVCTLAALCYAEFASTVPVAGSAYTFAYASLGELPAWIIGWDLVLELALGCAVVAVGWSGYVRSLLDSIGWRLPGWLSGTSDTDGFGFDLLACALVLLLTGILTVGMKLSARVTSIVVTIKVGVVLLVIVAGAFFVTAENYDPFIPPAQGTADSTSGFATPLIQVMSGYAPTTFGVMGIFTGAAVVFFAFIGFDVVATTAEETRNPQRDMPRGILGSLIVCTVLYIAVSIVVTGMRKYTELTVDAPLADAFKAVGEPFWAGLISFGAAVGLTTVCMILLLGQSRVFFAMSRDRLLPPLFARVHPRFGTPYRSTVLLGVLVAVAAGFIRLTELAELVNIGTLFAFVVVAVGVIILRRTRPDLPRAFRTPLVPALPIASVLTSLWLMLNLPSETWARFAAWMALGAVLYAGYGRRRSRVRKGAEPSAHQVP